MNNVNQSSSNNSNTDQQQDNSSVGFKSQRSTTQMLVTEQNKLYEKVDTDGAHSGYVLGYN